MLVVKVTHRPSSLVGHMQLNLQHLLGGIAGLGEPIHIEYYEARPTDVLFTDAFVRIEANTNPDRQRDIDAGTLNDLLKELVSGTGRRLGIAVFDSNAGGPQAFVQFKPEAKEALKLR